MQDEETIRQEVRRLRADMDRMESSGGESDPASDEVEAWGDDGVTLPHQDYELVSALDDIDDIKTAAEAVLENWERYPALYDLYDRTATTIKVRGAKYNDGTVIDLNDATPFDFDMNYSTIGEFGPKIVQVAGVHKAVIPDQASGASPEGTAKFDTDMTISANELFYLYFKTDLTANPATTKCYFHRSSLASSDAVYADGGDFTNDTESRLFVPLWWVEFSGGAITRVLDMRTMPRFDRAGN